MSILVTVLWILGLSFLAILWLGFAASVYEMFFGIVGRREEAEQREGGPVRPWARGLVAGAVGYGLVVLVFAGLNLLSGRSVFLTPALLGQSLLGRPVGEAIAAGPVLVYNGLHLIVFLVLGMGASWFLYEAERHPKIWYPGFVLLLVVFLHAIGVVLWLAAPAETMVPTWAVVGASAIAGVVMALVLLAARPTLAVLRRADLEA